MKLIPVSAFKDNYIWMMIDTDAKKAWVVDPGESRPVIAALAELQLDLAGILLTHHHFDHTGGVDELVQHWKNIPVYGSHISKITAITHPLKENDEIHCGALRFKILEIPGHTLDHLAYYNDDILFCGDTLFSAGCGRVFEGTPPQMYQSLSKLRALPPNTKVYCGHEYTLANLNFAQAVEPENQFIIEKILAVKNLRDQNEPTLPSLLTEETKMNPFLRCQEPSVISAAESYANQKLKNEADVFAVLREWKNKF